MTKTRTKRVRITVSLPADLVRRIDRKRTAGTPRSRIVEALLEESDQRRRRSDLETEVDEYYRKWSTDEDEALARASGRAGRRLQIDEPTTGRRRR